MIDGVRFGHTNLIARDWRQLARFYIQLFGCTLVPPERNYSGPNLERGTGIPGAALTGAHLRLPGCGEQGPTLEAGTRVMWCYVTDPEGNIVELQSWLCQEPMALPPLRKIGDTLIQRRHQARCHCGGVVLELDLPEGVVDARRCTCSMCRRKGVIMTAEHYFCSRCGIYTHHRRRSKPNQYGFNLGCLEGVDPDLVQGVPVNDGQSPR